ALARPTYGVVEGHAVEGGAAPPSVAVLFVDLDRFKVLNDSLGHSVGDAYLGALARRLGNRLQVSAPRALLGRLGGDEFAIVAPSTDEGRALDLAAAVLTALDEPVVVD